MRIASGIRAPRAARQFREAAMAAYHNTTADARRLLEECFEEILRDGELSEETAARWDALPAFVDAGLA
jgi:hypothetical protein